MATLLVMDRIDMLEDFEPRIDWGVENKEPIRVWLSAQDRSRDAAAFSGL